MMIPLNPSFLFVPHNSFVIVYVIVFFRNIVYLYMVFMDFCINIWLMEKSWIGLFKDIDIVLFRNFPVQSFEIGFCGRAEINYVVNRAVMSAWFGVLKTGNHCVLHKYCDSTYLNTLNESRCKQCQLSYEDLGPYEDVSLCVAKCSVCDNLASQSNVYFLSLCLRVSDFYPHCLLPAAWCVMSGVKQKEDTGDVIVIIKFM